MEDKRKFLLTWPSIIVFIPFTLLSFCFMLWILLGQHPEALQMIIPGVKSWALKISILWIGIAAGLVIIYRLIVRGEEGDQNV